MGRASRAPLHLKVTDGGQALGPGDHRDRTRVSERPRAGGCGDPGASTAEPAQPLAQSWRVGTQGLPRETPQLVPVTEVPRVPPGAMSSPASDTLPGRGLAGRARGGAWVAVSRGRVHVSQVRRPMSPAVPSGRQGWEGRWCSCGAGPHGVSKEVAPAAWHQSHPLPPTGCRSTQPGTAGLRRSPLPQRSGPADPAGRSLLPAQRAHAWWPTGRFSRQLGGAVCLAQGRVSPRASPSPPRPCEEALGGLAGGSGPCQ